MRPSSSLMSEILILKNHPPPSASAFTVSGASTKASFASVISPATGV